MSMIQKKGNKPDTNSQKKEVRTDVKSKKKRLSQSKSFESRRRGSRFGGDSDRMDGQPRAIRHFFGGALSCFLAKYKQFSCCTLIARTPAVIRYPESETIPIKTLLDWPGEP